LSSGKLNDNSWNINKKRNGICVNKSKSYWIKNKKRNEIKGLRNSRNGMSNRNGTDS
jgi:hypothetical protein